MSGGEIIAVVAILSVCSVAGVTWSLAIRAEARALEMLHAERMAAIEKGLPPPEEPVKVAPAETGGKEPARQAGGKESQTRALGTGLFWLFVGLGFTLAMRVVYPGTTQWGWGIILVSLGLAYLVGHWLTRGRRDADGARRDAERQ